MPNNILTEEQQKRVDDIEKRWARYSIIVWDIFMFMLAGASVFVPNEKFFIKNCIVATIIFFGGLFVLRFAARLFVGRLSPEEQALIVKSDNKHSRNLFNACKIDAKKEYLRASEPQNDTLLRAAAHTNNTPQEQLLRPANDKESHP